MSTNRHLLQNLEYEAKATAVKIGEIAAHLGHFFERYSGAICLDFDLVQDTGVRAPGPGKSGTRVPNDQS